MTRRLRRWGVPALLLALAAGRAPADEPPPPQQAETIATQAFVYGYPMVQGYRNLYEDAVPKKGAPPKAPFNTLVHEARIFTPQDAAVTTPNGDTPYSHMWADLRAEPLVLGVPKLEKERYYSIQFVDLYTYNFAYVGTATTGNEGGSYLLAGPRWRDDPPKGIAKVIRSETDFAFVGYRTQIFGPDDLAHVLQIQAGYTVQPLSQFLNAPRAPAAPRMGWPAYGADKLHSLAFFDILSFLLQFCPVAPGDEAARADFERIGILPGRPFVPDSLAPELRSALQYGIADGQKAIDDKAAGEKSLADLYGTRDFLGNDFLKRAVAAKLGLFGSSKQEASYFSWRTDAHGAPLSGATDRYVLRFAKDALPPVNAFWSLSIYDGKTLLLVPNPIDRYRIGSPMLPALARDADGGLTIYIQKDPPGPEKAANWLPAPAGPMLLVLRCYWPKQPILDGSWTRPPIVRVGSGSGADAPQPPTRSVPSKAETSGRQT